MRITPYQLTMNSVRAANQHGQRLAELQAQVSSGLRIQRPSDEPSAMADLITGRSLLGRTEVDLDNITVVRSTLNQTVTQLVSAKDGFTRAKTLAIDGVQSSEREALALEVDGILDLLIEIANSTDGTNSLFSGVAGTPPFSITERAPNGDTTGVGYHGEPGNSQIVVGRQLFVEAFFSGEDVFLSQSRGETYYSENTGATHGSGTDSFVGHAELTVRHTSASISGASGIALAASTSENTIIGSRDITVNSTAQTIQLGQGPEISFDGTETDLRLVDERGATLVVDLTGMTPGFDGVIAADGQGTFSFDGGVTEIAIDFSQNQAWEHTDSGTFTYVDTRGVFRAGSDLMETVGTNDAFASLIQLRDDLRNERNLEGDEWNQAIQRRLSDVERIHDHLLGVVGKASVSLQNLDAIEVRAIDLQVEATTKVTELESADMVSVIAELQSEQNLLQFTYAASANLLNGTNLLDFLR